VKRNNKSKNTRTNIVWEDVRRRQEEGISEEGKEYKKRIRLLPTSPAASAQTAANLSVQPSKPNNETSSPLVEPLSQGAT
jgi:hypothetical protein